MKIYLRIFVSITVVQLALGANDPKAFYRSTKVLVEKIKPILQAVIKDVPSTPPAFAKFKTELETFLKSFEADKAKNAPCFLKTFGLMNKFADLLAGYEKPNGTKEAKEVFNIFQRHGLKELNSEFVKLAQGYDLSKLGNDLQKFVNSHDPILKETC